MESPNTASLTTWFRKLDVDDVDLVRVYRTFNAAAPAFERESERHGPAPEPQPRSRRIKVAALARVEGEGAMSVRIRDRDVLEVQLRIYEPPRFFEAMLRGRSYTEVPDITARICGICPVAYQTSGCARDRAGLRRRPSTVRSVSCAGCSTAASGSRATRCTYTCFTRPISWATKARSTWPPTIKRWLSAG